ncbi:hypothetical protein [Virgisporangium aurantiacum]|uniref:SnoaL-like domain-containing protein n=1 Tax=Virgisporangium aurantiacum TaxID=175570 RepID=A0A8J4DZB5_9ACTN|nr:hypothetical protein [Virgisporangium aurantiacum]GIJ56545.1 hypothetical protein Vau01_040610 [Virgisporangium aurantiacum]
MKLGVVRDWLEAVNDGDAARLVALTTDRVEIVGPRGAGPADREVLADWLTRSGFSARSLRWFCGTDGSVVVEQVAAWRDGAEGVRLASQFLVDAHRGAHRVARYVRHDGGLEPALAAAGLTVADEVFG